MLLSSAGGAPPPPSQTTSSTEQPAANAWEQLQEVALREHIEPRAQPQALQRSRRRVGGSVAAAVGAAQLPLPGSGAGTSAEQLDPAVVAAKLAATRLKNRAAQQRFRARQRQQQRQAVQQGEALQQQIGEVAAENEWLHRQSIIYSKVLAVRDAMLQTFTSLQPSSHGQRAPADKPSVLPSPACAAAHGLAGALEELPSEREMDDAAPMDGDGSPSQLSPRFSGAESAAAAAAKPDEQAAQHAESDELPGDASGGASSSSASLDAVQSMQQTLGEQHRSGTASQLDGSALRKVESIPPASDRQVVARVEAMTEPEHLLEFFRQWQVELKASYLAAKVAGFDADSVADVEAVCDRMTAIWWHVGQLKPDYLCHLTCAALPENSGQLPLWREIAEEVMQQLDERSISIVRRSWHNYSKRMAKIAVGVSRWVRRLQAYALQPPEGLVTNANRSLELLEITSHMAGAVQEEYVASMEFVAAQFPASSTLLKAHVNFRSAPYLPDLVAIVFQMLHIDEERRRRSLVQLPEFRCGAVAAGAAVQE